MPGWSAEPPGSTRRARPTRRRSLPRSRSRPWNVPGTRREPGERCAPYDEHPPRSGRSHPGHHQAPQHPDGRRTAVLAPARGDPPRRGGAPGRSGRGVRRVRPHARHRGRQAPERLAAGRRAGREGGRPAHTRGAQHPGRGALRRPRRGRRHGGRDEAGRLEPGGLAVDVRGLHLPAVPRGRTAPAATGPRPDRHPRVRAGVRLPARPGRLRDLAPARRRRLAAGHDRRGALRGRRPHRLRRAADRHADDRGRRRPRRRRPGVPAPAGRGPVADLGPPAHRLGPGSDGGGRRVPPTSRSWNRAPR